MTRPPSAEVYSEHGIPLLITFRSPSVNPSTDKSVSSTLYQLPWATIPNEFHRLVNPAYKARITPTELRFRRLHTPRQKISLRVGEKRNKIFNLLTTKKLRYNEQCESFLRVMQFGAVVPLGFVRREIFYCRSIFIFKGRNLGCFTVKDIERRILAFCFYFDRFVIRSFARVERTYGEIRYRTRVELGEIPRGTNNRLDEFG